METFPSIPINLPRPIQNRSLLFFGLVGTLMLCGNLGQRCSEVRQRDNCRRILRRLAEGVGADHGLVPGAECTVRAQQSSISKMSCHWALPPTCEKEQSTPRQIEGSVHWIEKLEEGKKSGRKQNWDIVYHLRHVKQVVEKKLCLPKIFLNSCPEMNLSGG